MGGNYPNTRKPNQLAPVPWEGVELPNHWTGRFRH